MTSDTNYSVATITKGWSLKFRTFVFGNYYLKSSPNSKLTLLLIFGPVEAEKIEVKDTREGSFSFFT